MKLTAVIGIKESGGHALTPWEKPIVITRGQHCKLGIIIQYPDGVPIIWTSYTMKVRFPLADGTVMVKTAAAINYNRGEGEIVLAPADTLLMGLGNDQGVEIELHLTATPTITSMHAFPKVFSVSAPMFSV